MSTRIECPRFDMADNYSKNSDKPLEPEKPKSLIWKYFTYESSYNFSRCSNCTFQLPGSDINQLKEHLREHRGVYREFKDARKLKHSNQDKKPNGEGREVKYSEVLARLKRVKPEPRDDEVQQNTAQKTSNELATIENKKDPEYPMNDVQRVLEIDLSLFMSSGNIPVSGLQFPPFKRLLNKFRPDFSLPSNSFNIDLLLDSTYNRTVNKMKEVLKFVDRFTLMISVIPLENDRELSALCISIGFKLNGRFETMLLSVCEFDVNTYKAVCNLHPIFDQTMKRYDLESKQVINTFLSGFIEANIQESRILFSLPHIHQKQILDLLGMEIHGYVSWTQNINQMERNAIVRLNKKFSNYTAAPQIPLPVQKTAEFKAPNVELQERSRSKESPRRSKGFQPGRHYNQIQHTPPRRSPSWRSPEQEKSSPPKFRYSFSPRRRSSSPGRRPSNFRSPERRRSKRSMSRDSRSSSPQQKIPRRILHNFPTPVITLCQVDEVHFNCERVYNLMSSIGHVLRIKFLEKRQETCMVEFQRVEDANMSYEYMNRLRIFGKVMTIKPSRSKKIHHDEKFSFVMRNGEISSAEYQRMQTPPKIREDISYPSNTLQFTNAPPEMTVHELRKRLEQYVPRAYLPVKIGHQKDVNEFRGFMEFENREQAAEAIAYFNNLHFCSSYNLQLRFWGRDTGDVVWT